ncbi:MAG: twin-arginine translocase subunit TatC [Candidatus Omnitrophica bacterium]|nr:twin-arginine translocase subunit TatC [Candidatus Omnitrophota bacterium]
MAEKRLPLIAHLEELKSRLIKSIISILITSVLAYSFVEEIIRNLAEPVGRLVFIAPAEAFLANIKVALFCGIFLSSPLIIYQMWQFIKSGLKRREERLVLLFAPFSFLLFTLGGLFGYFIIVPIGIKFLLGFATDIVRPMITIDRYISFLGILTLAFGIIFQLPLISLFLTKLGVIGPRFLSSKRREAIIGIFILAAILTPPDVVTQCLMAVPLLALYEISIIFSKIVYKKAP